VFVWLLIWLKFLRIAHAAEWLIAAVLILLLALVATVLVQQSQPAQFQDNGAVLQIPQVWR
jgi:hypothetical protein